MRMLHAVIGSFTDFDFVDLDIRKKSPFSDNNIKILDKLLHTKQTKDDSHIS